MAIPNTLSAAAYVQSRNPMDGSPGVPLSYAAPCARLTCSNVGVACRILPYNIDEVIRRGKILHRKSISSKGVIQRCCARPPVYSQNCFIITQQLLKQRNNKSDLRSAWNIWAVREDNGGRADNSQGGPPIICNVHISSRRALGIANVTLFMRRSGIAHF